MIIKHIPNSLIEETNTDKLPDVDAMILEKCEELRQLCFKAKRQAIIIADARGEENGLGTYFWNIRTKNMNDVNDLERVLIDSNEAQKAFTNLMSMTNQFILSLSNSQFAIMNIDQVKILQSSAMRYQKALEIIADYDGESIWSDDRDDAANNILSIARVALGREDENGKIIE